MFSRTTNDIGLFLLEQDLFQFSDRLFAVAPAGSRLFRRLAVRLGSDCSCTGRTVDALPASSRRYSRLGSLRYRFATPTWVALWIILLATSCRFASSAALPPRQRGILRVARIFDPQTLDPATIQLQEDFILLPLLHLPLLDELGGTNVVPCAAKSWQASPDKRIYTLELRPEIKFSNGRPVVASDYVYGIERALNPATAATMAPYLNGIRGAGDFVEGRTNHVAGISAPDSLTLVIELAKSDPTFPFLLTSNLAMAVPAEEVARLGKDFGILPVGCGPYVVKRWRRGARLELARNPYYAGPEPQHLDGVDIMIGGDETTHLMMFERGDLDIANINGAGIPQPSMRRMKQDPLWGPLIQYTQVPGTSYISLNTEIPPLDNLLVRRAINHAINRDKWMQVALGRFTHAEGPLPPLVAGYDPQTKGYTYNPTRARQLLQQSGVTLPLKLQLWHSTEESTRFIVQGIQNDLKAVGIELELRAATYGELMTAAQSRKQVPMTLTAWYPSIPDPVDMLGTQFDGRSITNQATMNLAFYNNPAVNRLFDEAAPEIDLNLRFARYREAERLIIADAPWVCLGHLNILGLPQPWIKGPLVDPIYWYRFDRVWIER